MITIVLAIVNAIVINALSLSDVSRDNFWFLGKLPVSSESTAAKRLRETLAEVS